MIVYIIGRFPPPFDGQTLATRRMSELVAAQHEVRRINTEPPASDFVENEVAFRWKRVRHYVGAYPKIRAALSKAPSAPVLWTSISPALLGHYRDMLTVAAAFRSAQPVAGVVHRSGYDSLFRSPMTRSTAKRLVARLSAVVFLNERQSSDCAEWIPERKRIVIPNTVDRSLLFSPDELRQKRARRRQGGPLRLLFLSNLIPLKGYLDVVEAAAILKARPETFEIDFVGRWGSGADCGDFETLIERHGLQDVVTYHGGVDDRAAVKEYYRRADVFVLPTYHPTEAQPVALIEAMNAGLPAITTRQGGIPSMFAGDEAVFVPARDPSAIADAAIRLLDTKTWIDYSLRSRRVFNERFSEESVGRKWNALVESMARGAPPA